MAGLIKNQILKHLSKFAKNVSANSVNVSTLRGEGELYKLELNENVLNELLELPSWMKIVYAFVNKVSLKIQWTKLKSTPILVNLDEVQVIIETVDDPKGQSTSQHTASYMSGGKYGFSDKVIDGITVTINSVVINLKSPIFVMSLQISRMILCSKSPTWQTADLRMTRLKDPFQQHVLIFKELTWETLKIEAKPNSGKFMPVRLITNRSCCRITIKKKFNDCSVVGCRLVLFMDDILWALTDSQLMSAFEIADSLEDVIKKSTHEAQKEKGARKLESIPTYKNTNPRSGDYSISTQGYTPGRDENTLGVGTPGGGFWGSSSQSEINSKLQIFRKFDVIETSYHFFSDKIELDLCDDPGQGRSFHPDLKDGGSLQMEYSKFKIDFYPYHLALGDRTHWIKYPDGSLYKWIKNSLSQFKNKLFDSFTGNETAHAPLERASPHIPEQSVIPPNINSSTTCNEKQSNSNGKSFAENQFRKLMSTCFVVSCADININFVNIYNRKSITHRLFTGDKKRKCFQPGTPFLHLESTHFFYPGGYSFPVPPPKLYVQAAPVILELDRKSLLWINAFASRLSNNKLAIKSKSSPPYMDICLEALLPKIIIRPSDIPVNSLASHVSMHVFVSRVYISNVRESDPASAGSRSSLFTCLEAAQSGELFFASDFPSKSSDLQPIPTKFLNHALGTDYYKSPELIKDNFKPPYNLESETLWTESRDVLFINLDPVWIEFVNDIKKQSAPQTFVQAFPLHLWLHMKLPKVNSNSINSDSIQVRDAESPSCKEDGRIMADVYVIAYTANLVSAQLNHCQFVFLMRLLDSLSELSSFISYDFNRIRKIAPDTLLFAGNFPQVDVSFIIPVDSSQSPSQCTSNNRSRDNISMLSDSKPALVEDISETALPTDEFNLLKSRSESCLPSVVAPEVVECCVPVCDAKSTNTININTSKEKLIGMSSVKRGISSGFSSLLNTLDVNAKSPDDASDSMSINSDLSNESDNFVMIFLNNDASNQSGFENTEAVFGGHGQPVTEIATEVVESPIIPEITSDEKNDEYKQMVTTVTFSICRPQVIYETVNLNSTIKLQSKAIACEEVHLSRYEEFMREFEKKCSLWTVQSMNANPCTFRVRLETKGYFADETSLSVNQDIFRKCFEEDVLPERYSNVLPVKREPCMEAEIRNISLALYNSTAVGLLSLMDDEFTPLPLPFKVSLANINVGINEDKETPFGQREYSYSLNIPQMLARRDLEGNISLHLDSSNDEMGSVLSSNIHRELNTLQIENQKMKDELEESSVLLRKLLNENVELKENFQGRRDYNI